MRIWIVCAALCVASPASSFALSDIEIPKALPTAEVSFAYSAQHGVGPVAAQALAAMRPGEDVSVYRREDAQPVLLPPDQKLPQRSSRSQLCNAVAAVAAANDLPVPFFANLIQQESAFRTTVVSPVGAQGIAQFMPRTARAYGLENPFDPIHAIQVSGQFLKELVAQFGNFGLAAAAYNAGAGRVLNWVQNRGKLPDETQNYVKTITGRPALQWARPKKDDEAKLPAHARCPELELATAGAVAMHEPAVKVALAEPVEKKIVFRKGKSIVIAASSDKGSKSSVTLAPSKGSLTIMAEEKGAKSGAKSGGAKGPALASAQSKPVALSKTITKVAGGKVATLVIAIAETKPAKSGAVAGKIQDRAGKASQAKNAPTKSAPTKTASGKTKGTPDAGRRLKVAEAR